MRVREVAKKLDVCVATVYALIASGRLRHFRIGNGRGAIRVSEEHVAEFLTQAEPAASKPVAPGRHIKLKHLYLK